MTDIHIYLFFISLVVWLFGTLAGGGGAILFLSIAGLILPVKEVAPVTSIAGFSTSVSRIGLFFKHIEWGVLKWLLSGSVIGAVIGAHLLAYIHLHRLMLVLAVFLIVNPLAYFLPGTHLSFRIKNSYYFPVGVVTAFTSAFIGAVGPFVNIFFLQSNITKERMLATNACNICFVQIVKIVTYVYVAHLDAEIDTDGSIAAIGAVAGSIAGKQLLPKLSTHLFKLLANVILLFCGTILLYHYIMR